MKAREYDKVDYIKKHAEQESRIGYLTQERELIVKEKLRLEKDLVAMGREKQQLVSRLECQEQEIESF
jgi:ABC-type Mn2+/Zn2+ transport system ATPase subunit